MEKNIQKIFDYFVFNILIDSQKYTSNNLINIFVKIISNEYKLHKNTLTINEEQFKVKNFDLFLNIIKSSKLEPKKVIQISDRLIEDTDRRNNGDFYTPAIWVDEAHKMITDVFGSDWKEKYVVWDCACGTGNLTRDYDFKELYCSTLNKEDIEIGSNYNKNATKFQYDFLELGLKLPDSLKSSLENNKPFIFFINPPYATAGNSKAKNKSSKDGVVLTDVNREMKKNKIGACSQQLYAQFVYRILMIKKQYKLTNVNLCIFSPSLYMSGSSFVNFRKVFLNNFKFEKGIIFNASHFSNVKSNWAIDFAIWKAGEEKSNEFKHEIKDIDKNGEIIKIGGKVIYNIDNEVSCTKWIDSDKKTKQDDKEILTLKSAINIGKEVRLGDSDCIGYLINDSNNVYANTQGVYLISSKITRHIKTIPIKECNFEKCMTLFSVRKIIKENWINQKDEYIKPNEKHKKYKEFVLDSVIYALFNNSSYQSSMRNLKFDGKLYNIENKLFFVPNNEIRKLAEKHKNDMVLNDAKTLNKERFVCGYLEGRELSKEASNVLNKAKELIQISFEKREELNKLNPEYHLNCWDIGWYQIKLILKEYFPEELKKFNLCYKKLEDKMEPIVYELGFLK